MRLVILGVPPSKSNQYNLSARSGKARMFPSAEVKQYEKDFLKQVTGQYKEQFLATDRLVVWIVWYKDTLRGDADGIEKVILDCLQKARVIHNDNKIDDVRVIRAPKDKTPRIEIFIEKIKDDTYFYQQYCDLCMRFQ